MTERAAAAAAAARTVLAPADAGVVPAATKLAEVQKLAEVKDVASGLAIGACVGVGVVLLKMAWEQRAEMKELKDALFVLKQSEAMRAHRDLHRPEHTVVPPPSQMSLCTRAVGRPPASQLALHQQQQQMHAHLQQPPASPQGQLAPLPSMVEPVRSDGAGAQHLTEPVNPRLELANDAR
jgi:hypothetical protein